MNKKIKITNKFRHLRHWEYVAVLLIIYDVIVFNLSYFMGLFLRFDLRFSEIPQEYLSAFAKFAPIYTVVSVVIFYFFKLYKSIWRFASYDELVRVITTAGITTIIQIFGITLLFHRMPVTYFIIGAILQLVLTGGVRFSYRFLRLMRNRHKASEKTHHVMIIGAGAAGMTILREINSVKMLDSDVKCLIDDNPNKWGRIMFGVPVVGGRKMIKTAVEKYKIDQIMFTMPSVSAKVKSEFLNICKDTGCELKSLPGLYQLANGEVSVSQMKDVDIIDLLGRDPIKVDNEKIFRDLTGKTILVTGGGGSIGSELCRQIAAHDPKQLIIFDIYENNAYEIEQELKRKYGSSLNLTVLIGSVRDSIRIGMVFEKYRPDIVYHAAAHKHVPLMENSPNEAIKNNVIGTYKTAYAAMKYGTKKFVLISTDKAVNPTNVMGASKRICEMIIQTMDRISSNGEYSKLPMIHSHYTDPAELQKNHGLYEGENGAAGAVGAATNAPTAKATTTAAIYDTETAASSAVSDTGTAASLAEETPSVSSDTEFIGRTQFVAVRFGNVLGSNGSVIPLFKKQIAEGGPVTVTHPDIIRYFMTIPEAVSLVLQAGGYAKGGEIFILDMGEPVKIDTLARNLIRLSGYTPDVDIKVEYTGLRPGEKLYEEKLMAEEGMQNTANNLIHIGKPITIDTDVFLAQLNHIFKDSVLNDPNIADEIEKIVPTFHHMVLK